MRLQSLSPYARKLFLGFAACSLLSIAYTLTRPVQLHLTLEMAASQPSIAQLFYDTGGGFNERDSASLEVTSNSLDSFQELSFVLPRKTIFHLRFDPLVSEGRIAIRNVAIRNRKAVLYRIPPSDIQPFNQIATRTQNGHQLQFATTAGANDPGLLFVLREPLRLRWVFGGQSVGLFLEINAFLVVIGGLAWLLQNRLKGLWRFFCETAGRIDYKFEVLASRLSSPFFIRFDALAIWVYAGCLSLFLLGGLLDLNGSSEGMYSTYYGHGARVKSWVGSPRAIRSDEWGYQTPDILNQYLRADRFAAEDSVLGSHYIALTGNVPVRHISTLFRPQLWPFFVLPLDYAYAFFWQARALFLIAGVFTFLLWITGSSAWALVGALWYWISPFTQWSYSWPSSLPVMIGSICLAAVFFGYLLVGRNSCILAICAIGCAICIIDFALCAYLPHMIPLFWVGAVVVVAWCITSGKRIFVRDKAVPRLLAGTLLILLVAAIGWRVYSDLGPAIHAVAQTVFPGQRVVAGGSMPIWELGSHFMQWTETENQFPSVLGNISEGSGFLWLAPVTLFSLRRAALSRFQKAALMALWGSFLLILCWLVLPLPVAFGQVFALDRTFGARCLPALGLANVGIVALCMTGLFRKNGRRPMLPLEKLDLFYFPLAAIVFLLALRATNIKLGHFFTFAEVALFVAAMAFLATLMLTNRQMAFGLALIAPLLLVFGGVNPVERGLSVFTKSELYQFVQQHRDLLYGRWLVFSDTPVSSGFLAAVGCQVYTGTRYLPDIDDFPVFASRGLDLTIFNRLGYLDAHAVKPGQKTQFVLPAPIIVRWDVSPGDLILRKVGIRYVAFDFKPGTEALEGLIPLCNKAVDGFWLYKLPKQ